MSLVHEGYAARQVCALLDFPRCQLYRTATPAASAPTDLHAALRRRPANGPPTAIAEW